MALHERTLGHGMKMTVIREEGDGVVCGFVGGHTTDGRIKVVVGSPAIEYWVSYAHEGVVWIRGHAREGEPAAEALLAANKLSRMRE